MVPSLQHANGLFFFAFECCVHVVMVFLLKILII